ncbi:unnamed protein product, partial [Ectocarpus sp. 13 AM-2016]
LTEHSWKRARLSAQAHAFWRAHWGRSLRHEGRSTFTGSLFPSEALPLAFGMSSCDDLFYLDIDYSSDRDGCYEFSSTINLGNAFFLDGIEDEGSAVVYASENIVDDNLVWVLGNVNEWYDGGTWDISWLCRDAAFGDASSQDPWEVVQWNCYSSDDDDYTRLDEISITCSCGTTPAPTTLSCDDSFSLDVDYSSVRDGCYEVRTTPTINGEYAYFLNGIEEDVDSSVVYTTDDIVDDHVVWVLGSVNEYEGGDWDITRLCRDAALGDGSTQDPWEVAQWDCYSSADDAYTRLDEISITCSCDTTPAPTAGSAPAPTVGSTPAPAVGPSPFPTVGPTPAPTIGSIPAPSNPPIATPSPTSGSRVVTVTPAPTVFSTVETRARTFTPSPIAIISSPETISPLTANPFPSPSFTESTSPFTLSPLPKGQTSPATVASSGGGDSSTMSVVAGAVGGGLVVGVIVTVVLLFKTGRLKRCGNGNATEPSPGVGSIPAAAPSATSRATTGTQLRTAVQYPEALRT